MEKFITTNLNGEELQTLIIEAVKKANQENNYYQNPDAISNDYLSQREAAKFLRISLPTIIRWKNARKVPYYQEGRKVLFKKSELLQVLQKNQSLLK